MKQLSLLLIAACFYSSIALPQNNAVYLDGSGDYLSAPASEVWALGTGNFTLSFWMTLSDLNRIHNGFFGRDDYQWIAMEYNHDGDRRINLWIDSNGSYNWNLNNLKPAKNNWTADTWYNIGLIRDGDTVKILIDGEMAVSTEYSQTVYNPVGVPLYFGRSQLPQRTHFGQMDDIRMWNYALSESNFRLK